MDKKILIIDPNDTDRAVMASFLRSENFQVDTGRGFTDAVRKISEMCFHCLILDVELPEMNGYEAVPVLKRIDEDIKIIMTARENTKSLEAKVREQNIFFYFIKSFEKKELKQAINNAFGK